MKKHRTRSFFALALILLLIFSQFVSCGGVKVPTNGGNYAGGDSGDLKTEESAPGFSDPSLSTPDMEGKLGTKVIKNYRLSAEATDFDNALNAIQALVADHGGYVESASTSNQSLSGKNQRYARYASYTLRIPAEQADAFVSSLGTNLHLTSNYANVQDVSEEYYSIEARLEELVVERDSLLDILEATETKKDYNLWLTVKQRLSEVTQQIAVYQGQLNRYDSKIAYSTVELSVSEVLNYSATAEDNSFGARLGAAFADGWNGFVQGIDSFVIFAAQAFPVILLIALLATVAALTLHKVIKKRRSKKEPPQE